MRDLQPVPVGNGSSAGKRSVPLTEPRRIKSPPAFRGSRDPTQRTKETSQVPAGEVFSRKGLQDHTLKPSNAERRGILEKEFLP